jgi:hypothetical protein
VVWDEGPWDGFWDGDGDGDGDGEGDGEGEGSAWRRRRGRTAIHSRVRACRSSIDEAQRTEGQAFKVEPHARTCYSRSVSLAPSPPAPPRPDPRHTPRPAALAGRARARALADRTHTHTGARPTPRKPGLSLYIDRTERVSLFLFRPHLDRDFPLFRF